MFEYANKNKEYIKTLQTKIGITADGIAGPNTLKAAEEYYNSPVISHKGRIIPIDFSGKINHNYSLHSLPDGSSNWYYRKNDIDNIVVHWGGLNAPHCFMVFFNPKYAHTSSHFLIGYNPTSDEIEVLQCLDTYQVAYHAGKANKQSIGIDICQSPVVKHFSKTRSCYPGVEVVKNSTNRGPSDIVDLDERLGELSREFITSLNKLLQLDHKPVCDTDEVFKLEQAKEFSVIGHHNLSVQKWDVLPWADRLYHGIV